MTALSYGRRAEAQADASAVQTLHAAGLRADGLGRFFAQLTTQAHGEMLPAFLSDHPGTASRADVLRVPPAGASAMSQAAWQEVRAICQGAPAAK